MRLDLLMERGDAGDEDLRFRVSLDGAEAKPKRAEAWLDPEQLDQRWEKGHWA